RLQLLYRCSRLQPADVVRIIVLMTRLLLIGEGGLNPHPHCRIDEHKVLRHHSYNSERASVQPSFASEASRIASADLLPQPITQNDFLLRPGRSLRLAKRASQQRGHLQQMKERWCCGHRLFPLRRAANVDRLVGEPEGSLLGQGCDPLAPVKIV